MKKKKTLYLKFIITYVIFGVLAFVTIATFSAQRTKECLIEDEAASLYKVASLLSNKYASFLYSSTLSPDEIIQQLDTINSIVPASIWIVNTDGEIIYASDDKTLTNTVIDGFNLASDNDHYKVGDFYGAMSSEMLSVYSTITYNYRVPGYVILHYPMDTIYARHENLLMVEYMSLGIVFVLSLLILIVFTDAVYIPLNQVTTAAEEYANGNLKYTFDVNRTDEMGYLCAQLNYMAGRLSQQEDNQKKFVANVSHDFRSPLTSIHGYLDAMADGTIPPEMHEKYIKIVLNETERLTKLTNSLLALNNLNTTGMVLEITDFDINKVIKDTIATFEGMCKEKKLKVRLILSGKELFVSADMGRIQQVLYNLIDNAIKFSDKGKKITIETSEKNETAFISVKDEGIGIPKESIKNIFDRFYKTDLSRGKDKKGTGLGLAITKEIIKAHNEHINVISTVGVGSEFIFTLPLSNHEES